MPIDRIKNKWLRRVAIVSALLFVFPLFAVSAGCIGAWDFVGDTLRDLKDTW